MSDKEKEEDVREILIEYANKTRPDEIVEIPASWKVTFGPWSVSRRDVPHEHRTQAGWTLRIYEAKDRQRAVFSGVAQFRDLSIPLKRRGIGLVPDKENMMKVKANTDAELLDEIEF